MINRELVKLEKLVREEREYKNRMEPPQELIKSETTKIIYRSSTGSGSAVYTTVELYPDHLVWNYSEARNNCSLKDIRQYKKEEFDELVKELSTIKFSVQDNNRRIIGGGGYEYVFETDSGVYLLFADTFQFSGDYDKVGYLIQQFITSHKTQCEILFEEYSKKPHEKAEFGEFKKLPQKLQKYKVKRSTPPIKD